MAKLSLRNQSITASVTSFNPKGNGQASIQDAKGCSHAVEIPFSLPGDTVAATGWKKVKKWMRCRLNEVLKPSSQRIDHRCKHFGVCGGCRWQQMNYEDQLAHKQAAVAEAFVSLLKEKEALFPIAGAARQWHYRNKMEFSFSQDKEGNSYLGLIQDSSRKVLNIEECHLVNSWYAEGLDVLRKWWKQSGLLAYQPNTDIGSLRVLTLREGMKSSDRLIMLTVSGHPDYALTSQHLESFVQCCTEHLAPKGTGRLSVFFAHSANSKRYGNKFL